MKWMLPQTRRVRRDLYPEILEHSYDQVPAGQTGKGNFRLTHTGTGAVSNDTGTQGNVAFRKRNTPLLDHKTSVNLAK